MTERPAQRGSRVVSEYQMSTRALQASPVRGDYRHQAPEGSDNHPQSQPLVLLCDLMSELRVLCVPALVELRWAFRLIAFRAVFA
jgi:hypothetical protein